MDDKRIETIRQALVFCASAGEVANARAALDSLAADLARHAEVGPTILTTLIGNITIGTRKQYAEQSSHWTPGQKTENELLQRVWNLAEDSLALIDLLIAAEARHAQTVEALRLAVTTIEGLADQQAMPDDWYLAPLAEARAALAADTLDSES